MKVFCLNQVISLSSIKEVVNSGKRIIIIGFREKGPKAKSTYKTKKHVTQKLLILNPPYCNYNYKAMVKRLTVFILLKHFGKSHIC